MTAAILRADARALPLPDASVDSIVCDPPYNLSDNGKRDRNCLRRVIAEFALPHDQQRDAESVEGGALAFPPVGGTPLGGMHGTVRVDDGVGVPEGAVDLKGAAVGEQEVHAGDVPAMLAAHEGLPLVGDVESVEDFGHFVLQLADCGHSPFCDATCRCFAEPSAGVITVLVALPGATGCDLTGDLLGGGRTGNPDVRLDDDARGEAEGTSGVLASGTTERRAVLRLDLLRRTGELRIADRAHHGDRPLFRLAARPIGTGARTGGLSTKSDSARVRIVGGETDGTFTLDFPWHAFNSISPGHAKGFMGKEWDGWESPAAFERWCLVWAREAYRVLKPGGFLLSFGGSRTWHRLTCAIEDAGFEIRDSMAWMYGSGFPKSHDVSKAIDKAAGAEREVVGIHPSPAGNGKAGTIAMGGAWQGAPTVTAPATDDARRWEGWGTALKPGFEPIVVARKPLAGTVAANVLAHGTGALNIDGCRIEGRERTEYGLTNATRSHGITFGNPSPSADFDSSKGRWPTNVVLSHPPLLDDDGEPIGDACAGGCVPGCPVAELDAQSGVQRDGVAVNRNRGEFRPMTVAGVPQRIGEKRDVGYGGQGGASRFFPTFRYEAKAPDHERPRVDGVAHPTVKPLPLIRFLCRLVTPPAGRVLDMFGGSGTTGEAALMEGFDVVVSENEAAYLPLIQYRVDRAHRRLQPGVARLGKAKSMAQTDGQGELDLFGSAA